MIYQIQKLEYDEIKRQRKHHFGKTRSEILFKCANGFYYKQDRSDFIGLKEVQEFKKRIADSIGKQESLL